MSRLAEEFARKVANGRKLLVPYVTAGAGADWVEVAQTLARSGADALEIGLPFSDPTLDGPTVQEASVRALAAGTTAFGALEELAHAAIPVPLIVMAYANTAITPSFEVFAARLRAAGVDALILPDVPLEEAAPFEAVASRTGIDLVQLASPASGPARLGKIAVRSRGFVYAVSHLGTTGERATLGAAVGALADQLKRVTDLPVVAGFGITTPAHAAEAVHHADGVVVASTLMRRYLDGATIEDLGRAVRKYRSSVDAVAASVS